MKGEGGTMIVKIEMSVDDEPTRRCYGLAWVAIGGNGGFPDLSSSDIERLKGGQARQNRYGGQTSEPNVKGKGGGL